MSGSHHHDPIEDNIETHPVKLAIGIAIGTVALIIGIILLTQFAVGMYGSRTLKDDPSMSKQAVEKRIAPVGRVEIDPAAPAVEPPKPAGPKPPPAPIVGAAIPPPPAKGAAAADAGKATYDSACVACHGTGAAGAPKLGDKAAWAPRIKTGKKALYASALGGKGAMPPKGGNTALPDEAVKAAVDYLLAAVK